MMNEVGQATNRVGLNNPNWKGPQPKTPVSHFQTIPFA